MPKEKKRVSHAMPKEKSVLTDVEGQHAQATS